MMVYARKHLKTKNTAWDCWEELDESESFLRPSANLFNGSSCLSLLQILLFSRGLHLRECYQSRLPSWSSSSSSSSSSVSSKTLVSVSSFAHQMQNMPELLLASFCCEWSSDEVQPGSPRKSVSTKIIDINLQAVAELRQAEPKLWLRLRLNTLRTSTLRWKF